MWPNPQFSADLVTFTEETIKGAVMQIEKVLTNYHLRVSKVSWKFYIPNIHNFAAI